MIIMGKIPKIKELRKKYGKISTNGFLNPMCDFLAFYPAKIFLYLPLTPNQITVLWIVIKLIMLAFIAQGGYWNTIIALFVFQLASIIDGVDGIVARYRKHYSLNGLYIDYIGHYLCNSLLLIALAFGVYNKTGSFIVFVPASIAAFSFLLAKAITVNLAWFGNLDQRKEVNRIIYTENVSLKSQKKGILAIVSDFFLMDNPLNFMFWGVLFNLPSITLWVYAVLLFSELLRKGFLQFWKIYKDENRS